MLSYIEIKIQAKTAEERELLIAILAEEGFEGFEESEDNLLAFVAEINFNRNNLEALMRRLHYEYTVATIEQQNWNQLWESNFEPVQIGTFCHIRAHFHPPAAGVDHEIVITPKMSFGTGHHATTGLMIEAMKDLDIEGKAVLDFGTGTGVLAILAEKLGAGRVDAIDVDEWSIANARENFCINHTQHIFLHQASTISLPGLYDVVLANINKNVILENMGRIKSHLAAEGLVLLSGLLTGDCDEVVEAAAAHDLALNDLREKKDWILLNLAMRQY